MFYRCWAIALLNVCGFAGGPLLAQDDVQGVRNICPCVELYPDKYPAQAQLCPRCKGQTEYFQPARFMNEELAQHRAKEETMMAQAELISLLIMGSKERIPLQKIQALRERYMDLYVFHQIHGALDPDPIKQTIYRIDEELGRRGALAPSDAPNPKSTTDFIKPPPVEQWDAYRVETESPKLSFSFRYPPNWKLEEIPISAPGLYDDGRRTLKAYDVKAPLARFDHHQDTVRLSVETYDAGNADLLLALFRGVYMIHDPKGTDPYNPTHYFDEVEHGEAEIASASALYVVYENYSDYTRETYRNKSYIIPVGRTGYVITATVNAEVSRFPGVLPYGEDIIESIAIRD